MPRCNHPTPNGPCANPRGPKGCAARHPRLAVAATVSASTGTAAASVATADPLATVIPFPTSSPAGPRRPRRRPVAGDVGGRPAEEIASIPPPPDRLSRVPTRVVRGKSVPDRRGDWKPRVFANLGYDTPEKLDALNRQWSGYFSADDIATSLERGQSHTEALEESVKTSEMIAKAQQMMLDAARRLGVTPADIDKDIDGWLHRAQLAYKTTDPAYRWASVSQHNKLNNDGMLGWSLNRRIVEAIARAEGQPA